MGNGLLRRISGGGTIPEYDRRLHAYVLRAGIRLRRELIRHIFLAARILILDLEPALTVLRALIARSRD